MKKEIKWKFTKTKSQSALKVSNWIVNSILKLPTPDLKVFKDLIEIELTRRGDF